LSPLLVGLTGGLASGKSTVARLLADAGCRIVDADRLVAELYAPGAAGAAAIEAIAGPEVLDTEGGVDHRALAARVFADGTLLRQVEQAIHPLVRRRFEVIAGGAAEDFVVLEATRLVEAGYRPYFDLVVTVEAERATRRRRAVARGLSADQADARLAAQGDGEARRAAADVTLRNDGSMAELEAAVEALLVDFRRHLEAKRRQQAAE
jgi:dephospho-CoA kinase